MDDVEIRRRILQLMLEGRVQTDKVDRTEPVTVVLVPCDGLEVPCPGSIQVWCERCGTDCWASPDIQGMLGDHKGLAEVLCARCLVADPPD